MAFFKTRPFSGRLGDVENWVQNTINQFISDTETPQKELFIAMSYAAPSKLVTGTIVLADGTDWNPGSGAGFYGYYAGSWHKLG